MGEFNSTKARTTTAANIDITELRTKCDQACKILLSDKEIAARILKSVVEEFKETEIEDIKNTYIEGKPMVSSVPVNPDETNARIDGKNSESSIYGEGTFTFDLIFNVLCPDAEPEMCMVRMIINIEAQNRYNPGYPIPTRGIYYCCRMISSQYNREFKGTHYEDIRKVYSIWVCMEPAKSDRNTITTYRMMKENDVGVSETERKAYDLISVSVICLGGEEYDNYNGIIKMLDVLMSVTRSAEEKKQILSDEFGILMERTLEKEIDDMCNISDYYFEKGISQGTENGIKAVVEVCRDMGLSVVETAPKIAEKFLISGDVANDKVRKYWNE